MTNDARTPLAGVTSADPQRGREMKPSHPPVVDEAMRRISRQRSGSRAEEVPTAAGQAPHHRSVAASWRTTGPVSAINRDGHLTAADVVPTVRPEHGPAQSEHSGTRASAQDATRPPPVRRRRRVAGLSDEDRATVRAAVAALDPMSDDQVAAVCEVITVSRQRRGSTSP